MELSEETKKDIEEARKEIKKGKFYTLEQVEKEAKLGHRKNIYKKIV